MIAYIADIQKPVCSKLMLNIKAPAHAVGVFRIWCIECDTVPKVSIYTESRTSGLLNRIGDWEGIGKRSRRREIVIIGGHELGHLREAVERPYVVVVKGIVVNPKSAAENRLMMEFFRSPRQTNTRTQHRGCGCITASVGRGCKQKPAERLKGGNRRQ